MDIIESAENVVGLYSMNRLNAALHSQKVCGCRACAAKANRWVDWVAGEDDEVYERLHVPSKWERIGP
jgi:hypothetical protein